jgi:hypothetical protein
VPARSAGLEGCRRSTYLSPHAGRGRRAAILSLTQIKHDG